MNQVTNVWQRNEVTDKFDPSYPSEFEPNSLLLQTEEQRSLWKTCRCTCIETAGLRSAGNARRNAQGSGRAVSCDFPRPQILEELPHASRDGARRAEMILLGLCFASGSGLDAQQRCLLLCNRLKLVSLCSSSSYKMQCSSGSMEFTSNDSPACNYT